MNKCARILRTDALTRVSWHTHMCVMTHLHVRHDLSICVPWLRHIWGSETHTYEKALAKLCNMCKETHEYEQRHVNMKSDP